MASQAGSQDRQDSGLPASEREGGYSLRGGHRRGSADDGRWEQNRLVQEAHVEQYPISRQTRKGCRSSHMGKPMRCRRFWKRGSERRGSKPGRSRTPGLNLFIEALFEPDPGATRRSASSLVKQAQQHLIHTRTQHLAISAFQLLADGGWGNCGCIGIKGLNIRYLR